MRKTWSSVLALAAAMGLGACGGSDDAREDNLGANWTLTIVSPEHGAELGQGPVTVEVAVTGRASARGESQDFDIGFLVNGDLVEQTADHTIELFLPAGSHTVRVEGLSRADGLAIADVTADEITIVVDANRVQPPREPSDFENVDIEVFGRELRSNPQVDQANLPEVQTFVPDQVAQ